MAGTFILGEQKVRPGSYFNIQTKDSKAISIMNGVTDVMFKADFGPLNTVVELDAKEGYESVFVQALLQMLLGKQLQVGQKQLLPAGLETAAQKEQLV